MMTDPLLVIFDNPNLLKQFKEDFKYECDELYRRFSELMVSLEQTQVTITDKNLQKKAEREDRLLALQSQKVQWRNEITRLSLVKKEKSAALKLMKSKKESILSSIQKKLEGSEEDALLQEIIALENVKAAETENIVKAFNKFSAWLAVYQTFFKVKIKFTEPDTFSIYFTPDRFIQFQSDDLILWKISGGSLSPDHLRDLQRELSKSKCVTETLRRARKILASY